MKREANSYGSPEDFSHLSDNWARVEQWLLAQYRTFIAPTNNRSPMCATELESWDVERREDGAVLVRVHSCDRQGHRLPDAVFSFRLGDPQYDYWEQQLCQPSSVERSY